MLWQNCNDITLEQAMGPKNLDIILCKRNKYQFSKGFRGMGLSMRLLSAKKNENGKIYALPFLGLIG